MGKSFFHRCRLLISFIKFHLYIICQTKVSCHCCLYKVAAEQKARTTYDNILRLVKDPEVCEPIRFLREREIVHYQRFGESLRIVQDHLDSKNFYAINPEFDIRPRDWYLTPKVPSKTPKGKTISPVLPYNFDISNED